MRSGKRSAGVYCARTKTARRNRAIALAAVGLISACRPAFGTIKTYIGPAGQDWNTSSFWSPAGIPATGDVADFFPSGLSTYTLDTDYLSGSPLGELMLGNGSNSAPMLNQSVATFSVNTEYLASGTFNQAVGLDTVNGFLIVGEASGGSATYSFASGTLSTLGLEMGVNGGTGTFIQSGNATSDQIGADGLATGSSSLNLGTYSLAGGTLTTPFATFGTGGSRGTFLQSGSLSNSNLGTFTLGTGTGSSGTTTFSGGSMTAALTNFGLGGGAGTFSQTGSLSNSNLGTLAFGNGTGSTGTGSLSGGSMTTMEVDVGSFGGTGTFVQSGSLSVLNLGTTGYLNIGNGAGSRGTFNMSGGSLSVSSTNVGQASNQGASGSAAYIQSGGSANLATNGYFEVGNGTFEVGIATLTGGTLTAFITVVGLSDEGGAGTFVQSGGVSHLSDATGTLGLLVGVGTASPGAIALSGGSMSSAMTNIGVLGEGTFLQSAGSSSMGSPFAVGVGGYGIVELTGGTMTASFLDVGTNDAFLSTGTVTLGSGTFIQSGGFASFGSLVVGNVDGSTGYLALTGGTLNVGTASIIGNNQAHISGGVLNVTGQLSTTGPGLILDGGEIITPSVAGGSTIQLSAGTFEYTFSPFIVGGGGPFGGALTIGPEAAVVVPGQLSLAGGNLFVDGGTLSVGSFTGTGLNFTSGALVFTGTTIVSIGGSGSNNLGASLVLGTGAQVDVMASSSLQNLAGGYLGLAGGSLFAVGGFTNYAQVVMSSPASQLVSSSIGNFGSIRGTGQLIGAVTSEGTASITAEQNDNLLIIGSVDNESSCSITAESGGNFTENGSLTNHVFGTITIGSTGNFAVTGNIDNAGSVLLQGGNLTVGSLTNESTGRINGHGDIQTTNGVFNSGSILFNQQVSEVTGSYTNNSTGVTNIAGNSQVDFDDSVTNATGSVFNVVTGSTAVFNGPVTGVAAFTGGGVKQFLSLANSVQPLITTGSSIVGVGGLMSVATVRENALEVDGKVTFNAGGGTIGTGSLSSLSILPGGLLDLTNHALVISYGKNASPIGELTPSHHTQNYPAGSIQAYIQSTFDGGAWDGPGLGSSSAENDPFALTAVGALDQNDLNNIEGSDYTGGTWMGLPITSDNTVLVRYTYYGDTDLDGRVGPTDVNNLELGFQGFGDGWVYGDFNYDGVVDGQDVDLLDLNFANIPLGDVNTLSTQQADWLLANENGLTPAQVAAFEARVGVPEPVAIGLLGVGAMGLLGRRRR